MNKITLSIASTMLLAGAVFSSCNKEGIIPNLVEPSNVQSPQKPVSELRATSNWRFEETWTARKYGDSKVFTVNSQQVLITATKDTGTQADCYLYGEWLDNDDSKPFTIYLDSRPGIVSVHKIEASDIYGKRLQLKLRHQGSGIGKIGAIITVASK